MYYFDSTGTRVDMGRKCPDRPCNTIKKYKEGAAYTYYFSTFEAPYQSVEKGIKDFYVEINGDVDTLYLDVTALPQANPAGETLLYNLVKHNGVAYDKDDKLVPTTYVFKK